MHLLYFYCVCVCADDFPGRILRRLQGGERQVLTQHRGAAHSPGAPVPPVVCSPGNSSLPGCAAPSCAGYAGWASGSAAQTDASSWCWSGNTWRKRKRLSTSTGAEQHAKNLFTDIKQKWAVAVSNLKEMIHLHFVWWKCLQWLCQKLINIHVRMVNQMTHWNSFGTDGDLHLWIL